MKGRIIAAALLALALVSCGDPKKDQREELYSTATDMVRGRLKVPSSARFSALADEGKVLDSANFYRFSTDSVIVTVMGTSAIVNGYYEGQNSFGVFLPGMYQVMLKEDSGKWVGLTGNPESDVELSKE